MKSQTERPRQRASRIALGDGFRVDLLDPDVEGLLIPSRASRSSITWSARSAVLW